MGGKRIGVTDIAYYADRLTVFEKQIIGRTPQGKPKIRKTVFEYRVNGLYACKIQKFFVDGKAQEIVGDPVSLREIFGKIKHVYDFNHVLIARRNALDQPLRVTGKGMSKFLEVG